MRRPFTPFAAGGPGYHRPRRLLLPPSPQPPGRTIWHSRPPFRFLYSSVFSLFVLLLFTGPGFPQSAEPGVSPAFNLNGRWEVGGLGPVEIRQENGRLDIRATGNRVRSTWTDGKGAFVEDGKIEIRFTKFNQPARINRVPIRHPLIGTIGNGGKSITWELWPDWTLVEPEDSSPSPLDPGSPGGPERYRLFTARDGRTFRGSLVSVQGDKIKVVREDLKSFLVPIIGLSDQDKSFLRREMDHLESYLRETEKMDEEREKELSRLRQACDRNWEGRQAIRFRPPINANQNHGKRDQMLEGLKATDKIHAFLKTGFPGSLRSADAAVESARLASRQRGERHWTSGQTGWERARELLQEALRIYETRLGPLFPPALSCLEKLGDLSFDQQNDGEAEAFYRRLAIARDTIGGEEPVDRALRLIRLAEVSLRMKNTEQAEKAAGEAGQHFLAQPDESRRLVKLAEILIELDQLPKAETLLLKSLEATIEKWGEDGLNTGNRWRALAALYLEMENEPKAGECIGKALDIFGALTSSNIQGAAVFWGDHLEKTGRVAEAEKVYLRALGIYQNAPRKMEYGERALLLRLADVYRAQNDLAKADQYYQQALGLFQGGSSAHGDYASLLFLLNRTDGIPPLVEKYLSRHYGHLGFRLSSTSEQERLRVRGEENPVSRIAQFAAPEKVAEAVLRTKGIVLESLIEDRLHLLQERNNPKVFELYRKRNEVNRAYQRAYLQSQRNPAKLDLLPSLESQIASVEEELAKVAKKNLDGSRRALKVTLGDVTSVLPGGYALVEYISHIDWTSGNRKADSSRRNYGAVIIRPDRPPAFAACGSREDIDARIDQFIAVASNLGGDDAMSRSSRALHDALISPLEPHLEGIHTLIISPEAQLNFVPFAGLLTPRDRFLIESHTVYYVASGRDLIARNSFRPAGSGFALIIGAPDFRVGDDPERSTTEIASLGQTLRAGLSRDVRGLTFEALPGTMDEARRIKATLEESLVPRTHLLTGGSASEERLRQLRLSPRFLHLATHGFYLREMQPPALPENGLPENGDDGAFPLLQNPMYRSGVALTGAQDTFHRWERGEVPQTWNDGVLMAAEVGELNLQGTELVTLSACSSAAGKAVDGEGIMGLRRGFAIAGAKNVLMTLWPIDDRDTVLFMEEFYRRYGTHRNAPRALQEVQRDWLLRLRSEKGLTHAVNRAGVFVMSARATSN